MGCCERAKRENLGEDVIKEKRKVIYRERKKREICDREKMF